MKLKLSKIIIVGYKNPYVEATSIVFPYTGNKNFFLSKSIQTKPISVGKEGLVSLSYTGIVSLRAAEY